MQVQSLPGYDLKSNVEKTLTVTIQEALVSAPPSPPIQSNEHWNIKWESALPLSLPPKKESWPVHLISHNRSPDDPRPRYSFEKQSTVAIIGVGYVGTHLIKAFANHYNVIAFDLSDERLLEVRSQLNHLPIKFTSDAQDIGSASYFLISVPTLLKVDKTIDKTFLRSAVATVEKFARPGSTVVMESSVAIGMTRSLLGPLMQSKRLLVGMSPERVDPGRIEPSSEDIPKIISGLDQASVDSISTLYGRVFTSLLQVSCPEVAEMTKLYENCQRMVCAAYANEMASACEKIGIDEFEVSAAAASKPFGYLPFRPGPGIGGHCIPVNPYYLLATCEMPLLQHAASMSSQRPSDIANKFMKSLIRPEDTVERGRQSVRPLRVLVVGIGFKRGQSELSISQDWPSFRRC